jgi:hypothetical protein
VQFKYPSATPFTEMKVFVLLSTAMGLLMEDKTNVTNDPLQHSNLIALFTQAQRSREQSFSRDISHRSQWS